MLIPLRLLDFTVPPKQCFGTTLTSRHPSPCFQNMFSIRSPVNAAVTRNSSKSTTLGNTGPQLPQSQYWLLLQKLLGINSLVNTAAAWYALKKRLSFTNSIKIQEHGPKILDCSHLGHVACRLFKCHFAGDFILLSK